MEYNDISLLIGSGFSIPGGYPSLNDINARMSSIKESEICVHTSGDTWFLNGTVDPNAWFSGVEERAFIEEFVQYYGQQVADPRLGFNYEDFYDFYISLYQDDKFTEQDKIFFRDYRSRHKPISDDHHLLMKFHHSFNQLLAGMLQKREERVHLCKPYIPPHDRFLILCDELASFSAIHIHSLNHDLLLEALAYSDAIQAELDDGFVELGSPFYGKIWNKYDAQMVRLPYFANRYHSRFRLYKLHGSIDFYWFSRDGHSDLIRKAYGVGTNELFKEVQSAAGLEYINDTSNYYPDFLAGRSTKTKRYPLGSYYPTVFDHFKRNLVHSNTLITIGYGFGDSGINDLILSNILNQPQKALIVVDIRSPKEELISHPNVSYIRGGVQSMDVRELIRSIR